MWSSRPAQATRAGAAAVRRHVRAAGARSRRASHIDQSVWCARYGAFADTSATFRELAWEMPIFSGERRRKLRTQHSS
jgi:hypothetical protein